MADNKNYSRKDFDQIVLDHQQEIYFFVRKMLLDHDDSNDVTQNTFIKAWKGIHSFRGDAKISTWITRIAYNEAINFLNKRKKIAGVSFDDISKELPQVLAEDKHYEGEQIQQILQAAIATLPAKQKAIFMMRYFEEKPYDEIASITGTSVGGLKASFHHAKKKVEEFVRNY